MRRLSYLQRTLALRCIRLIDQRHRHEVVLTEQGLRMFDLCIHASYLECLDAGCGDHVAPFYLKYQQRMQAKR
jgi:hypothetical protein